jgi:hypothetical protein
MARVTRRLRDHRSLNVRDRTSFYVVFALVGLGVGYLLGDHVRMTVPHGCKTGCGPDYGISGATAGAVWGAIVAIFVASVQRGWKQRTAAVALIAFLLLLTVFEPK